MSRNAALRTIEDAYAVLTRMTTRFTSDATLRHTLADVCDRLGKDGEALTWRRRAAELMPPSRN